MKQFLLALSILITSLSFGQGSGDLTIFSNTGDKFYVVLNGVRQNQQPETNVKIQGLTNQWYSCKIISANNNFTLEKNLGVKFDTLITYEIFEKKGKYKMRFYSETAMKAAAPVQGQTVMAYTATETTDHNSERGNRTPTETNTQVTETTTVTTTTTGTTTGTATNMGGEILTTTTTVGDPGSNESVNISLNMNVTETGANVNFQANESGRPGGATETVTTSTTMGGTETVTTNTTMSNGGTYYEETTTTTSSSGGNGTSTYYEETTVTTTTTTTTSGNVEGNLYQDDDMTVTMTPNATRCAMSDTDFASAKKSIAGKDFADSKMTLAKQIADGNCLTAQQIKEIMQLFTYENDKIEFAKYAYSKCSDQNNYYKVNDAFEFESSIEELDAYIKSRK